MIALGIIFGTHTLSFSFRHTLTHTSPRWFPLVSAAVFITPLRLAPTRSPLHHCQRGSLLCAFVCSLMHTRAWFSVCLRVRVSVHPCGLTRAATTHPRRHTPARLMQTLTLISITVAFFSKCQVRNKWKQQKKQKKHSRHFSSKGRWGKQIPPYSSDARLFLF